MQLVIGNYNYSSWSLRPWLLLKHFDLAFETIRIPLDNDQFNARIKRYSEAGKVPVLIDQGRHIWDSLAICEYLNEQYLDGRGWPAGTASRATARSVCAEMHSGFLALRTAMPMNCRAQRRIEFEQAVLDEVRRIQSIWNEARTQHAQYGSWLFGEFSIADCMYAPVAARFNTYHPPLDAMSEAYVSSISGHPALQEWFALGAVETETLDAEEVGEPR